jgi:hypothetical protein
MQVSEKGWLGFDPLTVVPHKIDYTIPAALAEHLLRLSQ